VRLVVIGPVAPLRGGIAQHTQSLADALANGGQLMLISFARLYPARLFPGEAEVDPEASSPTAYPVERLLRWDRPWRVRAWARRIAAWQPEGAVIAIWTVFWMPLLGLLARRLRQRGIPVVMMVHNVVDHEAAGWKRAIARWCLRQADGWVTHGSALSKAIVQTAGVAEERVFTAPHPTYDRFPPAQESPPRRAPLELLFFGLIRPYKGLDLLLEALGGLDRRDWHLTIAGEIWSEREKLEALIARPCVKDRVQLIDRYVSDQQAADLMARADYVVLPYRAATGSGVIAVAYNAGRPVVASAVGTIPDVVDPGRTGHLVPAGDVEALRAVLQTLSAEDAAAMAPHIREAAAGMTWQRLGMACLHALQATKT